MLWHLIFLSSFCAYISTPTKADHFETHRDDVSEKIAALGQPKIANISVQIHRKSVVINGIESELIYEWVSNKRTWEPHLLKLSQMLLPEGNEVVFDIGANMGYHTLQFAILVPFGHVYAFEPYPLNYMLLNKNIRDNSLSHISSYNRIVSDQNIELCFNISNAVTTNMGDIRLQDTSMEGACSLQQLRIGSVNPSRIDPGRLDLIKIDVQGFERKVLMASANIIAKYRPYIFIEFEDAMMLRMTESYSSIDLVQYIRDTLEYFVFAIRYQHSAVDHLLVPLEKAPGFRKRFHGYVYPLTTTTSVNRNVEAGVREAVCIRVVDCPEFHQKQHAAQ